MPEQKHNELKAGLFTLAAIAAGVGVLLWIGGSDVFSSTRDYYFYTTVKDGDRGVAPGSAVKLGGADIGRVTEVTFDEPGQRTLYKAKLDRLVYQDADAKAVSGMLGGSSVVVYNVGTTSRPAAQRATPAYVGLAPSAMLEQAGAQLGWGPRQQTQLQVVMDNVEAASGDVRRLTLSASNEVDPTRKEALVNQLKDMTGSLARASANVESITKQILAEVDPNVKTSLLGQFHLATTNVVEMTAQASELARTIRPGIEKTVTVIQGYVENDIGKMLVDFRKLNTELLGVAENLRAVSGQARDIVVLNRPYMDDAIANLSSMAANLNAAAKEIRRNPWRLLQRPSDKDVRTQNVYDAVRAFGEGAQQLDGALTQLKALRDARADGVKSDDPELIKIREHLKATFDNFRKVEQVLWDEVAK